MSGYEIQEWFTKLCGLIACMGIAIVILLGVHTYIIVTELSAIKKHLGVDPEPPSGGAGEGMTELKPTLAHCPFCGAVPEEYSRGDYNVVHKDRCYLTWGGKPMSQWIVGKLTIAAWNTRADALEKK